MRCTIWRQAAENVAESLARGARGVVQGLKQRSFQTKEGESRTVVELDVDEIGPSLRYATTTVTKNAKNAPSTVNPDLITSTPAGPADDPWGPAGDQELVGAGAGAGAGDKPPF